LRRHQQKDKKSLHKVLFLGQLPPPVHGVSLMNSYLVNSEIIKGGFDIDVISLQFGKSLDELAGFSIKKFFKALGYGFDIVRKNLNTKPDLVYFTLVPSGFAFYRDAYYVFLLKLFRRNILLHLHGKGVEESIRNSSIKRKIYTWVFKDTNVICLSKKVSTDIASVYKKSPFIIPNGVEVQPYFNRESEKKENVIPQILYLSNYTRSKGILVLIEALGIIKKKGYIFNARFVGAPFNLTVKDLEDHIEKHDVAGCAEIIGPLNSNDKFNEYKRADVFVFPTYFEAFGLVNLEAMQFSLPIVSTTEGSIPDIVDNDETGFLVEPQNAEMLAEKIAVLLDNKELRLEMGKRGYQKFINNYTLRHFESNINATFTSIIGSN
jgi:glycosyltransferase involved in cell wall biosynthesis